MQARILLVLLCIQPLVYGASQKKGVAHWAANFLCDDFTVLDNMTWWYDWRCSLNYYHDNGICTSVIDNYESTFIPMVWGFYWNTDYTCHTDVSNAGVLLGPNEPNHQSQSDLTPAEAAAAWPSFESNSNGLALVAPSAAPCGSGCNGNTTEWLDEFFALCTDCRVDYIATHTYWCGVDKTMDFLQMIYDRYGKPIWLTEFACRHKKNNPAKVLSYMQEILPRLESATFIHKYAWYMARIPDDNGYIKTSASLFEAGSSTLTALGTFYNNFQP
ncbi:uncharacterized protein LOC123535392 [Mercenaria mercenaria]|uniref:uncharacterized protein LOC123535392 n=1 Tax=Mercenaria mercenaria TaxID=6596 RepID=UPI00234E6C52|nr:uncharacterized protein LOC123535392 [Mercenaria mercenaria]